MDRRVFLTRAAGLSSVAAISGGFAPSVQARTSIDLGNVKIDTVSDGHLVLPIDFLLAGLPEEDVMPILERHGIEGSELMPDCNLTLLRDGDNTVLFDIGAGPNFMPTTGRLLESLASFDVDPAEVTHIVFTHAHPDHLWGLLDEFDDFTFPEAEYLINHAEWDYWTNPNTLASLTDARKPFAVGAARNLEALEDRVSFFKSGDSLVSGIHAHATHGHTPGHTSFSVSDGGDTVMIVGDAIANQHIAFEQPKWFSGTDQDADLGAKTRLALLDQLATDDMMMIGFHLPLPGVGRVEKDGLRYRFVPADR